MQKTILEQKNYLYIILLFIITFSFNLAESNAFWRFDDTMILKCALEHQFWQIFTNPEAYQCISAANFTPWVTFSYQLDYLLFGFNPIYFYWHQTFSLFLVAVASFWLLKKYVKPIFAFYAASLFTLSSVAWIISQELMVRHYLEGLLFAILAIYFFLISLEKNRFKYAIIGSFFYLLTCSAKEIYVPIILILCFIPQGSFRQRFYFAIPYTIAALFYIGWRKFMLFIFVGGYTPISNIEQLITTKTLVNFTALINLILGEYGLYSLLFILVISFITFKRYWILICLTLLVLPLLPVLSIFYDYRLGIFLLWSFIILVIFLVDYYYNNTQIAKITVIIALTIISLQILYQRIEEKNKNLAFFKEMDVVGLFAWQHNEKNAVLISPQFSSVAWYFSGLSFIKNSAIPALYNQINLPLLTETHSLRFWQYYSDCQCMKSITEINLSELKNNFTKQVIDKPLSISAAIQHGILSWKFGPYLDGEYYVVMHENAFAQRFEIKGITRVKSDMKIHFYLCYRSPLGWVTYSPEQTLSYQAPIEWQR